MPTVFVNNYDPREQLFRPSHCDLDYRLLDYGLITMFY